MRELNVGSVELVQGMITDELKHDLTAVAAVIELAVTNDEAEQAPVTGWAVRDAVSMIGDYTILPEKLVTASTVGFFILWARWGNPPEQVILEVGKFRVV